MSAADSETEQLLQLLQDSQSTSYVVVAALTVLVLDHIMTLGEEEKYMWGSKWNLAKTLYLWNRYFGLAALSFDAFYYVHPTAADTP
ncbi:hypothetical protein B0H13DRAFT_2019111 [Mycena leptocephala]|nr:hypothetical protein B0H13DRAFT_2019111 [Mycena leptocephala]